MRFSIPNRNAKYIALGSNLPVRKENLLFGLDELRKHCRIIKQSGLYETPALLPEKAPEDWNQPFLNMVIEIECEQDPENFLSVTKMIEKRCGRGFDKKWAPRPLDIDILYWDGSDQKSPTLTLPHPEIEKRSFVLDPLKDLDSSFAPKARQLKAHAPQIMGIINVTPDSFSDGGLSFSFRDFMKHFDLLLDQNVDIVDIGAESTRPGSKSLSPQQEWERLNPILTELQAMKKDTPFFPLISLDTYHTETAKKALSKRIDIINDVSGLESKEMLSVLQNSNVDYILSHSLGIPADPKNIIQGDPIDTLKRWLEKKWETLEIASIDLSRIIFDPGIGFGKSALQSQEIIRKIHLFRELPIRILVGHSRKSFFTSFTEAPPKERDMETIGTSMALIDKGVDILRVHDAGRHKKAIKGWLHARS